MPSDADPPRRNSKDSIWYVLATVAGDPKSPREAGLLVADNRRYWNALMAERAKAYGAWFDPVEGLLGRQLELPTPTEDDYLTIRLALNARGFQGVDIPHAHQTIDFTSIDFSQVAGFEGYVFAGVTKFSDCRFPGDLVIFNDTIFAGPVAFHNVLFHGFTSFARAEFAIKPEFIGANFRSYANFNGATFTNGAQFENSRFGVRASFDEVLSGQVTNFSGCTFNEDITFRGSTFKAETYFEGTRFLTHVPGFFEAALYEYTDWYDSRWPKVPRSADHARMQIQRYQRLIMLMNELQRPDDRHFFFRREMRVRRRVDGLSMATAMNWIYELVCDYGFGLGRIIAIWALHILAGALAMSSSAIADSAEREWSWEYGISAAGELAVAVGLSFSNAHVLLGLDRGVLSELSKTWSMYPLINLIGGIQAVVGVILLFFLLLTLRNRFRMR